MITGPGFYKSTPASLEIPLSNSFVSPSRVEGVEGMSTDSEMPDELQEAVEGLNEAGSMPPEGPWETLVGWEGWEATRALVGVMRSGGQAAIHAVRILAERGDVASIDPMVEVLVDGEPEKLLRDEIAFACHQFGESALEPLLEAHEKAHESGDEETMLTVLESAFETGGASERMSRAFARQVEADPAVVRRMLPEYEATDEVVEMLEKRAAAIPGIDDSERPDGEVIQAIWNTIEQLGGEIPDELRAEMRPTPEPESPSSKAEAFVRGDLGGAGPAGGEGAGSSGPVVYEDIGRNDPCPCGSGRKYKQCCMRKS